MAVFTAWPDLVSDRYNLFDLEFMQSFDTCLIDTFADQNIDHGLERFAVRVHDRGLYNNFEYCLFVCQPVQFDLCDLDQYLDDEHTMYVSQNREFAVYKRGPVWNQKDIKVTTWTEQVPDDVGIIFIDCWQNIQDQSRWTHETMAFDFFGHMTRTLTKYRAKNLVFHTGEYGDLPLARSLKTWHWQGHAVDILDLNYFQRHYRARNLYNWIVVGAHWQRCTHEKPLGFYNLLDIKHIDPRFRIFSQIDCTIKFVNNDIDHPAVAVCQWTDYEQDGLIWSPNGKLPELIGP